ncbi:DMT family transporter [Hoeflea prorocentri]|uniref:DMT family transporter n=1 Tax=Hoeflea prorocentri TaxID=1922333 RepID=A0A9X3UJZ6_9HYPH|nr:DMT family transporter [Hoeflea prorocentri]MCY6382059.1 DMT family transporter [Hoeflea prorocentri]MDA5399859.1 DMT family transporter [Hoeflea prorocentri]
MLARLAPALFVLLWSTGWISARYAAPYADPLTFLSIRYIAAAAALLTLCLAMRANWPASPAAWGHAMVSGVLLHGIYLGGVWWAIANGVPASLSGLIAALQPLLTALSAPFIVGERLTRGQWLGIVLGLAGLLIAIVPRIVMLETSQIVTALIPLAVNIVGMFGVTAGTIYQKRFLQSADLRSTVTLQYVGALAFTLPLALLLEDMRMVWNVETTLTMLWSVFGLSIGAVALLLYLIRRGQVSRAASLIYLVPPAVAIEAFLLFGERLSGPMIAGTIIVVAGVYLTNRPEQASA